MAILSETKTWLTILDKFCNGTPIPSGVAGAAVELIRVVEVFPDLSLFKLETSELTRFWFGLGVLLLQNVKKHQEDCFDIAELVYQITEGVLDATYGMKEDEMNGRLAEDLRIFERCVSDF